MSARVVASCANDCAHPLPIFAIGEIDSPSSSAPPNARSLLAAVRNDTTGSLEAVVLLVVAATNADDDADAFAAVPFVDDAPVVDVDVDDVAVVVAVFFSVKSITS